MSDEADGRACTEADSRNGIEADSRCTRFRTQQNRLLWPSSLPACLQTAYEALPERRFLTWSGRRGSNPRQPAWKAGTLPLSYSRLVYLKPEIFSYRSGCADLNRGPHGPKPCALPTAPNPANIPTSQLKRTRTIARF